MSMGHKESDTTEPIDTSTNLYFRCGLHLKGGWAGSRALFPNCVDRVSHPRGQQEFEDIVAKMS